MTRRTLAWMVPALITLHNAEEAWAFRRALPGLPGVLPRPLGEAAARVSYPSLLVALAAVSLLSVGVAIAVSTYPAARWSLWLLLVVEATMAITPCTASVALRAKTG